VKSILGEEIINTAIKKFFAPKITDNIIGIARRTDFSIARSWKFFRAFRG
jgi:hypothetical protein